MATTTKMIRMAALYLRDLQLRRTLCGGSTFDKKTQALLPYREQEGSE